jgi:hypothetical protein
LVEGDPAEIAIIQRIFHEFVDLRDSEHRIAEGLQDDGVLSPGGHRWSAGMVVHRLRNEKYVGTMVYNKTTKKLKTPKRPNPPEQWVRTPEAFDGISLPTRLSIWQSRITRYDFGFLNRFRCLAQ